MQPTVHFSEYSTMKRLFAASALALVSLSASAEGLYLGVGAGYNRVDNNTAEFDAGLRAALGGTVSSTADSNVTNIRLIGGYKVNENLALELGFVNSSDYSLSFSGRSSGVNYSGEGSVSFRGFDVSTVIRPSVTSGFNNLFGVVGIHNYRAKTEVAVTVSGRSVSSSDSQSGTGLMFGVGYDMKLSDKLDFRLSLIRFSRLAGDSESSTTNAGAALLFRL